MLPPSATPRPVLLGLAAGFLGLFLGLAVWHLWEDHLLIDAARANMARSSSSSSVPAARPPTPAPDSSQK